MSRSQNLECVTGALNRFNGANLTLNSDVDKTHFGKKIHFFPGLLFS